jgi:hypothetical protein
LLVRNPFNPQPLISHLTNSNGCGNLQVKVLLTVSPSRPSFPPQSDVYLKRLLCLPSLPTTHYPLPTFLCPLLTVSPSRPSFPPQFRVSPCTPLACSQNISALCSLCLSGKSHLFISLRPLCCSQKSQLLCNQANPASFSKTPGVGYPLTTRPRGISNLPTLFCGPSCNLGNDLLAGPVRFSTSPRPLSSNLSALCVKPFLAFAGRQAPLTPFRINTCKSASKQTTLSPFKINTCEKTGGGAPRSFLVLSAPTPRSPRLGVISSLLFVVPLVTPLTSVSVGVYTRSPFGVNPLPERSQ